MARNDFEQLCSLYLRLNGFFHLTDFTVHYADKNPEEIDFIGVRFPNSIEKVIKSNGLFVNHIFEDDPHILHLINPLKMSIVFGEATMSRYRDKIRERIGKLNDPIRIKYGLQRFGIVDNKEIDNILSHNSAIELIKILFVVSKKLVQASQGEVNFIAYKHILSFIQNRASDIFKVKGIALLPSRLQDAVTFLLSRDLDS